MPMTMSDGDPGGVGGGKIRTLSSAANQEAWELRRGLDDYSRPTPPGCSLRLPGGCAGRFPTASASCGCRAAGRAPSMTGFPPRGPRTRYAPRNPSSAGRASSRRRTRDAGSATCAAASWSPWRKSTEMAKRPNSRRNLDMAIRRAFGDDRFVRMRTLIANTVVARMLPDGVVRGGSALKMRLGDEGTRFTSDLDTATASPVEAYVRGWRSPSRRVGRASPASSRPGSPHTLGASPPSTSCGRST